MPNASVPINIFSPWRPSIKIDFYLFLMPISAERNVRRVRMQGTIASTMHFRLYCIENAQETANLFITPLRMRQSAFDDIVCVCER